MTRLRQLRELVRARKALAAALALAGAAYLIFAGGTVEAFILVGTLAAAVGAVWDPHKDVPRPELALRLDGKEPSDTVTVGVRRPICEDLLVEDAMRNAAAKEPPDGTLWMATHGVAGKYAEPTKEERRKFHAQVQDYGDEVRAWLNDVDLWRRGRASLLSAAVLQRNPATVDAVHAGISVIFPGTCEAAEGTLDAPSPPPESPEFPLRPSLLRAASLEDYGGLGHWPRASALPGFARRPTQELVSTLWEPDYERGAAELRVSWRRQPVRHGQTEVAGDPFNVLVPPGTHKVAWEVHASNLPKARSGSWTVECRDITRGDPITTVADLMADLGLGEDTAEARAA